MSFSEACYGRNGTESTASSETHPEEAKATQAAETKPEEAKAAVAPAEEAKAAESAVPAEEAMAAKEETPAGLTLLSEDGSASEDGSCCSCSDSELRCRLLREFSAEKVELTRYVEDLMDEGNLQEAKIMTDLLTGHKSIAEHLDGDVHMQQIDMLDCKSEEQDEMDCDMHDCKFEEHLDPMLDCKPEPEEHLDPMLDCKPELEEHLDPMLDCKFEEASLSPPPGTWVRLRSKRFVGFTRRRRVKRTLKLVTATQRREDALAKLGPPPGTWDVPDLRHQGRQIIRMRSKRFDVGFTRRVKQTLKLVTATQRREDALGKLGPPPGHVCEALCLRPVPKCRGAPAATPAHVCEALDLRPVPKRRGAPAA
jgi:hypothetical protein